MRNIYNKETLLVEDVIKVLKDFLPQGWKVETSVPSSPNKTSSIDAQIQISGPQDLSITLDTEIKTALSKATIDKISDRINAIPTTGVQTVIAPYFSPAERRKLENAGINGIDSTGWISIYAPPSIIFRQAGAARNPQPKRRSEQINRFSGKATSRVIRFLITASLQRNLPIGVRQIAEEAEVTPGTVSKLLPTLTQEGAIQRGKNSEVVSIDVQRLLDLWAEDYKPWLTRATPLFAARGVEDFKQKIANDSAAVITGPDPVIAMLPDGVLPTVPESKVFAYIAQENIEAFAFKYRLKPTTVAKANVFLAPLTDEQLQQQSSNQRVPLAQALVDLATLPSRETDLVEQALEYVGSR